MMQTMGDIIHILTFILRVGKGIDADLYVGITDINPFKPEFTIVIFIHYKPRIAVAILDL